MKNPNAVPTVIDKVIGNLEKIAEETGQSLELPKKKYKDPPKKHKNLHEDFDEASKELVNKLLDLSDNPPENPLLVVSTPGIGKTHGGLKLANKLAESGKSLMFSTPTRSMSWQSYDRIKGSTGSLQPVVMLEGRHDGYVRTRISNTGKTVANEVPPNCHNYDKIERARQKGYPALHYVCRNCPLCPYYKSEDGHKTGWGKYCCQYFKNIGQASKIGKQSEEMKTNPIIVTNHHMMAAMLCEGSLINPDWVIIDEDPVSALREEITWTEKEVSKQISVDAFVQFRQVLLETINVAKHYKPLADYCMGPKANIAQKKSKAAAKIIKTIKEATFYGQTALAGIKLARVMYQAAKNLSLDLEEVLEKASLSDAGISRGALLKMSDHAFQKLPHHREAELAGELFNILNEAHQGEDKVYKVSLRWDEERGWRFVWEFVRRMKFGGPMIFLDAYGSPVIVSSYCGREVDKLEVHCKARNNVELNHYWVKTTGKVLDNVKKRNEIFDKFVVPDLQRCAGKKLLVYTKRKYKDWVEEKIAKEHLEFEKLEIKWFWMDRGDDSYGDFDAIMIFGTPNPNIVAERHLANALFAGDEKPLSWESDGKGGFIDERVAAAQRSRRENELQQEIFRIRPSKPRSEPQEIFLYSDMRFDAYYELPGAFIKNSRTPSGCSEEVCNSFSEIYEETGCWADVMAAFLFMEVLLLEWLKEKKTNSKAPCPLTYDELKYRVKRVKEQGYYAHAKKLIFEKAYGFEEKRANYNGKSVRYYGDENKLVGLLDTLREAVAPNSLDERERLEREERPDVDHVKHDQVVTDVSREGMEIYPEPRDMAKLGDWCHARYQEMYAEDPFWNIKPEYKVRYEAKAKEEFAQKLKEEALAKAKQQAQTSDIIELPVVQGQDWKQFLIQNPKIYDAILLEVLDGREGRRRFEQGLPRMTLEERKESLARDALEDAQQVAQAAAQDQESAFQGEVIDMLPAGVFKESELEEELAPRKGFSVHLVTDDEEAVDGWTSDDGWPWKPLEPEPGA